MTAPPSGRESGPPADRWHRLLTWSNLYLLAVVAVFVGLWGAVIVGHDTLIAGDILRNFPPWTDGSAPVQPRNAAVSDPVTQFIPWLTMVRHQWMHGQAPLWNPSSFGGAPLLANDQSAPLSPFTFVAFPFSPAVGYSLAMLLKLVVAAVGMAVFVRQLGVRRIGATVAGVAFAGSSFMVVWMGHPHPAVAATFAWAFAFVEIWLRARRRMALVGLALAIALQFLAGHVETTLHMGLLLGFYATVRALAQQRERWIALGGIAGAGVLGTAMAAVQLLPFLSVLRQSTLLDDRLSSGAGFAHLHLSALISWLIPNGHGNPGIDGASGRFPNYLESAGFIGIGALLLSAIGLVSSWRAGRRSIAVALGVPLLLAAGVVYGPLSGIAGRLPLLSTSNNTRFLVVMCFALAALAGLGFQVVAERRRGLALRVRWARVGGRGLIALGAACIVGVVALGLVLAVRGAGVDGLLPAWHGNIGFWVIVALLSGGAAVTLLTAAWLGHGGPAAAGLACLALAETAIFAGPFQPRVPPGDVPPPSPAMAWLQANAGTDSVAGEGLQLIPDLAALYGLTDPRGVDITIDPRVRLYWSHADPGYDDRAYYTFLSHPGTAWLATAGVRYYVSSPGSVPAGAEIVHTGPGFAISEIPGPRPFAYAAAATTAVCGADAAVAALSPDPTGPVVVESCSTSPPSGDARVQFSRGDPGSVDVEVDATEPATVIVRQSFSPGWTARVDGNETPIWAADVLFQAVAVPPGRHTVTLRYEPGTVRTGLILSLAGAGGLLGLAVLPAALRRSRRRRTSATPIPVDPGRENL